MLFISRHYHIGFHLFPNFIILIPFASCFFIESFIIAQSNICFCKSCLVLIHSFSLSHVVHFLINVTFDFIFSCLVYLILLV